MCVPAAKRDTTSPTARGLAPRHQRVSPRRRSASRGERRPGLLRFHECRARASEARKFRKRVSRRSGCSAPQRAGRGEIAGQHRGADARTDRQALQAARCGCEVREGSIPARTLKRVAVWGVGRIRDSCGERLLCVQASRVEGVCGAPDWLIVRGSSLFGLRAITDEMPSQSGLGSIERHRTDRVTVSKGRRLSCPGLSESGPGDPRGGANGTG